MPTDEILKLMLQHKLEFLNTIADACMLWWVSSVVFCGSALSTVWMKRDEVKKIPAMDWVFAILLIFFTSIVVFGGWVIYSTARLQQEFADILLQLGMSAYAPHEFVMVEVGVGIGTTSFVFVVITWIGVWRLLRKRRDELLTQEADSETSC